MKDYNFNWVNDTRLFHKGIVLFVGKWMIGAVCWEGGLKGETKHYAAKSLLPGLKQHLDKYETEQEAKDRVEKATKYWIKELLKDEN